MRLHTVSDHSPNCMNIAECHPDGRTRGSPPLAHIPHGEQNTIIVYRLYGPNSTVHGVL